MNSIQQMNLTHMKHSICLSLGMATLLSVSSCRQAAYQQPQAPIQEVSFTQVHLTDSFWSPRIETNRTVSIPSAFRECERTALDNFAIAAA